jgi:hypothetical protein
MLNRSTPSTTDSPTTLLIASGARWDNEDTPSEIQRNGRVDIVALLKSAGVQK